MYFDNMKRMRLIIPLYALFLAFVMTSCQKEADYVLHIGESFGIELVEFTSINYTWEWENQYETDVVSMSSYYVNSYPNTPITDIPLGGNSNRVFVFKGEKKGFVNVRMVQAKGSPDFQQRINFSIRVIE